MQSYYRFWIILREIRLFSSLGLLFRKRQLQRIAGTPIPLDGAPHYPLSTMLYLPGIFIAVISAILINFSIVFSFDDKIFRNRYSDNVTRFLEENSEAIRNGTWNYSENKTFGVISAQIIDPWLERMNSGMNRYNFGASLNNFCWERHASPTNHVPSILRASQLFASVQVPLRTVFLMGLTFRSFLLYASLYGQAPRKSASATTSAVTLMSMNELLHISSLFIVFSFHIWQDSNYPRALNVAIVAALISFAIKMVAHILFEGKSANTLIRMVFLIVTLLICQTIVGDFWTFTVRVPCDQKVPLTTALAEYAFLTMEFGSYLLDLVGSRNAAIFVHCAVEDFHTYDRTF